MTNGLVPYDLTAPAQLLVPRPHMRRPRHRDVALGGDGGERLTVWSWGKCDPRCGAPGSHDAGHSVELRVPCDMHPHCESCDCLPYHLVRVSPEQVAALKAALP